MADNLPQADENGVFHSTSGNGGNADGSGQTTAFPVVRYPANLCAPPYDKWIMFQAMTGRHVVRNQILAMGNEVKDRPLASVGLYLPESALKSTMQVSYEQNDLGPLVGSLVEFAAQSGQNLLGAKGGGEELKAVKGALSDLYGKVKSLNGGTFTEALKAEVTKFVGGLTADLAGFLDEDVDKNFAAGVLFGQKPNPRTDVLFNTQEYRVHNLEFTLIPRSLEEAQIIDYLLYFFQYYMLPRYQNTSATNDVKIGSYMVGFPYEFEITMWSSFPGALIEPLSHVNRIGRSVLKSVAIDHAAGGKTAFVKNNGEAYPVATKLQLEFQEVRLLARDSSEIQRDPNVNFNNPTFDPRQ